MEKPPESLKDRKTEIMSIVKREREVSIKDITPVIKGVGEKTIQRELTALVKAGVLKKVGERRWSKYMLA